MATNSTTTASVAATETPATSTKKTPPVSLGPEVSRTLRTTASGISYDGIVVWAPKDTDAKTGTEIAWANVGSMIAAVSHGEVSATLTKTCKVLVSKR